MDERSLELIVALGRHPGWEPLFAEMAAEREKKIAALVEKWIRRKTPIDQREADEERGYYLATQYMQALPALAADTLKKLNERRASGDGGEEDS